MKSSAVLPLDWPDLLPRYGNRTELDFNAAEENELCDYLRTFLDLWEPQLQEQGGRFRWRLVQPQQTSSMTAIVFETESAADPMPVPENTDEQEWTALLDRLEESGRQSTRSKRIYIDGIDSHPHRFRNSNYKT